MRSSTPPPPPQKLAFVPLDTEEEPQDEGIIYLRIEGPPNGPLSALSALSRKRKGIIENLDLCNVEDNAKIRASLLKDANKPYSGLHDLDLGKCSELLDKRGKPSQVSQDNRSEQINRAANFFNDDFAYAFEKLSTIFSSEPNVKGSKEFENLRLKLKWTADYKKDLHSIANAIDALQKEAELSGWPLFKYWAWRLGVAFAAAATAAYGGIKLGSALGAMAGGGVLGAPVLVAGGVVALSLFGLWGGYAAGRAISRTDPRIAIADHAATLRSAVNRKM